MTNTDTPSDGPRYTFTIFHAFDASSSYGVYARGGTETPLKPWCRTARGAWDYVQYITERVDSVVVYRDDVRIACYGRVQRRGPVMEWAGYDVGWVPVKDRRNAGE